mmetsp:Transcript_23365/g.55535  ORF Transcript_23365/g.55535 Transcript_23365/m.55535 type:complete len:345 (+) Transcript_23365:3915-4949(+)
MTLAFGDVRQRLATRAEHIVVEQRPPALALAVRQVAQRQHRQPHCGQMQVVAPARGRVRSPPVVHQDVQMRSQGLNLMEPQRRDVDRIARFQLGLYGARQSLGHQRELRRVGPVQIRHHGHRRGRRRMVGRPQVEQWRAGRGQQREPTPAGRDTGDVVGIVEMRRHRCAIADPQTRRHLRTQQRQRIRQLQPRQHGGHQCALRRQRGWIREMAVAPELLEKRRIGTLVAREVEAVQARLVAEGTGWLGPGQQCIDCLAAVKAYQVVQAGFQPGLRLGHQRPLRYHPSHHHRLVARQHLALEALARDAAEFLDRLHPPSPQGRRASAPCQGAGMWAPGSCSRCTA